MKEIIVDNVKNGVDIINNDNILNKQNNALSEILNNVINWSIDVGLKYMLPSPINKEVINIKNEIMNGYGKNKIIDTVKNVINLGKEKLNNEKKEIMNIDDIERILKNPKIIKVLANTVDEILKNKSIKSEILNTEEINLKNVENKLNKEFENQINAINRIEKYKNEWYKNYDNKNFEKMYNVFKNIKKELKNIIPLENMIKEFRKIENLNQLVKSKGGDFDITKDELELANKLV